MGANLSVGNTCIAAEKIAKLTSGELFEISSVKSYPADYHACTEEAQKELRNNVRPELAKKIDISKYNTIILGNPNWWGTMPMPVWTFLESGDFSGKTIFPLCTHEGSGMGNSERDIKKLCPKAIIKTGLAIKGGSVNSADTAIQNWLKSALVI